MFNTNPFAMSAFGGNRIIAHPLGGCAMGETVEEGVVAPDGRVFDPTIGADGFHDGLYVCDGAAVPSAIGVSPLLTITALAERAMMLAGERVGRGDAPSLANVEVLPTPTRPPIASSLNTSTRQQGVGSRTAPAGPWIVATGGAQRNPWERRSTSHLPRRGRGTRLLTGSVEHISLVELDAVRAEHAQQLGLEVLGLVMLGLPR